MNDIALTQILLAAAALLGVIGISALVWVISAVGSLKSAIEGLPMLLTHDAEAHHRALLGSLHTGLMQQSDRVGSHLGDSSERLRAVVSQELTQTRSALHGLQLALSESLAASRQSLAEKLSETTQALNARIDERLSQIAGKVDERLEEGFKKTNETFVSVMQRLAVIDEAQKKIENLTGSVVSLQELLGDKRSRGAFGEVQLEGLVRNLLPPSAFEFQCVLSNGSRVDCVLRLPPPTGMVAVDSKFPLENYHRMFEAGTSEAERALAQKQFRADLRKHIDDISRKYIIPEETSDGAVMFVPAEAVFAEIHAYHAEVVEYAQARRVWIVSPTTLMAVLNTARAVIKDVETRRQIHIIKEALTRLGVDFRRFDERMKKLADHIRQAHQDAEEVQVSSRKISQQFAKIESADGIEEQVPANVVPLERERGA